jgi:CRP-like cAMP-binding protein
MTRATVDNRISGKAMAHNSSPRSVSMPLSVSTLALLDSAARNTVVWYGRGDTIFSQGDECRHILYIRSGGVMVSVLSKSGNTAVIAMLGPGDFLGEGCLAGQPSRVSSAVAIRPSAVLFVARARMAGLLHRQQALSERFIAHVLTRNIRMEEDRIDQILGTSETRLARTMLRLAHYGDRNRRVRTLPRMPEERLAELAGTTVARVSLYLERFRRRGFIEYRDDSRLTIHSSLLSVVLNG